MKIGVSIPTVIDSPVDPGVLARKAEELGFESIWVPEHPIMPVAVTSPFPFGGAIPESYSHMMDPFMALARASALTTTIKLGTGICLVPERNPLSWPRSSLPWTTTPEAGSSSALALGGTRKRPRSWAATSPTAGPRPGSTWRR